MGADSGEADISKSANSAADVRRSLWRRRRRNLRRIHVAAYWVICCDRLRDWRARRHFFAAAYLLARAGCEFIRRMGASMNVTALNCVNASARLTVAAVRSLLIQSPPAPLYAPVPSSAPPDPECFQGNASVPISGSRHFQSRGVLRRRGSAASISASERFRGRQSCLLRR